MSLKEKIQQDLEVALREKQEAALSVLRMLKSEVVNREKEKRYKLTKEKSQAELEKMGKESKEAKELETKSQLSDEEIIEVISSQIKKGKESIEAFEKGAREDLAKKERSQIEILRKYLPEQMSEDEIKKIVQEAVKKTGATQIKDMGKVMGIITPQLKGKADMSQVSKLVKEILSQ